jgi:hypothetical protein
VRYCWNRIPTLSINANFKERFSLLSIQILIEWTRSM